MSKINETNYPRRTQASYEDTDMLVIQESGGNTYTTRIEDLREDCQETLAPALNTMRENLATVEGSTASKAYAKGDFLVFGGRLCKAKTSIASGATLVLDTNIELDSVGDELSSLTSELTSLSRHSLGTRIQLTEDVNYVTTTNGYFRIAGNGTATICSGFVDGKEMLNVNQQDSTAVYVNKGTTLKVTGLSNGWFYPMT